MEVLSLNPDDIIVENRIRKDFGNVSELAESIKNLGQIHPVRITKDFRLIAGERRWRACKEAGINVLAIIKESTDPIELLEIEMMENLDRQDMTWQEKVDGLNKLHELKINIHGQAKPGAGSEGWSVRDTAHMINAKSHITVHDAIKMAAALKAFPELGKMKSQNDAKKKLQKITEVLAINELMSRKGNKGFSGGFDASKDFIVQDAFYGMGDMKSDSIDFFNVDTPYGIDLGEQKKTNTENKTTDSYQEWDKESYMANISIIAKECYRSLRANRWMIFWYGQEWYLQVRSVLEDAGFKVDKIPAVWYGGAGAAQTMAVEVNLGRSYEQFFVCRKGDPILVKRGRPNVFAFDKMAPQHKIHPTEKPLELMRELLDTFVLHGQQGCSPFIGSGNDLRAGYIHGCSWFGFDLNGDVKNQFLLRVEDDIKEGLYGNSNPK